MVRINVDNLDLSIQSLERVFGELRKHDPGDYWYEICRPGCVQEFEISIEEAIRLLRRRLRPVMATRRQADDLTFRGTFREGLRAGLFDVATVERWFTYWDRRNEAAHGGHNRTRGDRIIELLPRFIEDIHALKDFIAEDFDE